MPFFCYLLIQIQDLSQDTVKFSRKSQGLYFLYFLGAYFWPGLSTEGYFRFKIDWASLIVGSKCTLLALFYFVFEANFSRTSPRGAYICRGDLTEGFLHYRFGGLIFGGAYTWSGLFSEFYGISASNKFYTQSSRNSIQMNSFSRIGTKIWNEMPVSLRKL